MEHYVGKRVQIESDESDEADEIAEVSFDRVKYNRKMNRHDGAEALWTEEEDKQFDEEYGSGMKISEISKDS